MCGELKAPGPTTKPGTRFPVTVADGVVLMEAREIRCGDVWDCYPVADADDTLWAQEYGRHMVFTDAQIQGMAPVLAYYEDRSGYYEDLDYEAQMQEQELEHALDLMLEQDGE